MSKVARALVGMSKKVGESIEALSGRILALAKIAYINLDKRSDPVIQVQLAEFFTDA